MRRPRVLFFLYYFPPSGGPGVRRGLEFVKHLPDLGFEPVVVTVRAETYDGPEEYVPDPSGLSEVPEGTEVHRVPSGEPVRLKRLLVRSKLMRLAQLVLYPLFWERQALWPLPAIQKAERILAGKGADLVYTCCQPYASNEIGLALSSRHRLPWVTDHRDPFTQGWGVRWPSRLHHRMSEVFENRVLARATRFVANTSGQARDLIRHFPAAVPERIRVVPNGYDEEDFRPPVPPREDGRIEILHAGSFTGTAGVATSSSANPLKRFAREVLEHQNRRFDRSTHSPRDAIEALAHLASSDPDLFSRVELRLVGSVDPAWREVARAAGVEDRVFIEEPISHPKIVRRMKQADLLLLTTISANDGGPVACVSQKLYEYLRAGRPILAVSGKGDAADLVREARAGVVVPPRRPDLLADAIRQAAAAPSKAFAPRPEVVRRYDRRRQAERMAAVFEEALREPGFRSRV